MRDDPERTLVTLDQLSQTIEVMTSVVNRLRRHLSEQIQAQVERQKAEIELEQEMSKIDGGEAQNAQANTSKNSKRESFVVEINQQEAEPRPKSRKVLH